MANVMAQVPCLSNNTIASTYFELVSHMQIVVIDGLLQLHDVWLQAQYIKIVDFGNSLLLPIESQKIKI